MGFGIYPSFKPTVPEASFEADGKTLLSESDALDELSKKLGIKPFTSFGDNRPVPEGFDGDEDELEEIMGPWDQWFSIKEGLATIEALINAIATNPQSAALLVEPNYVLEELDELKRTLLVADSKGVLFRFQLA